MNWHKTSEETPKESVFVVGEYGEVRRWYEALLFSDGAWWNPTRHISHGENGAPSRWAYIEEPETCKWTHRIDQYGYGQCSTSCGYGVLDEDRWRGMVYCAFCGKRIEYVEVEP